MNGLVRNLTLCGVGNAKALIGKQKGGVNNMNITDLREAMKEAERFLGTAEAVKDKATQGTFTFYGCKETSACRRASMDLTRALVAIRR